ncbi:helix-turn-helix transcriptional regulator [Enterococcus hirae]|nr:helix-turn-helix transcriptional regulator [Enterococcus hirae]
MKNNLSKILGERLLKVSDIHKMTGIARSTLTEIYYQRALNVQLDTLQKICDALQIPLSKLIEYEPKKVVG